MSGWSSLGSQLVGNEAGNQMAYAKGMNLGATTEAALATARERVQKNAALAGLDESLKAVIPDAATRAGVVSFAQSDRDPSQLFQSLIKNQELGQRTIAADQSLPFATRNAALLPLASAPVERFQGENMQQDKFSNGAPVVTQLGQSLIDQREADAALNTAKRTDPAKFRAGSQPKIVSVGGISYLFQGVDDQGNPVMAPVIDPDKQKQNIVDTSGAKKLGTTQGANQAAAPSRLNDIDTMVGNVDKLIADPNFKDIYGANVGQLTQFVPGSGSARAAALREQLKSEAFSNAVQKMRGLGALSNAEGQKVQTALTRAMNGMLDPVDAVKAFDDLKAQLAKLRTAAIQEAGGEDKLSVALGGTGGSSDVDSAATDQPTGADYSHLWN